MKNLYIDFDGVILDTIHFTYDLMKELNIHPNSFEENEKFYRELDWKEVLKNTPQINDSFECIQKLIQSGLYHVAILTHVNSMNEMIEKANYIRKHIGNITVISVPRRLSKTQMVEAKDSILIDDYSGNLKEWKEAGGIGIRFNLEGNSKGYPVIERLDELLDYEFVK